MSAKFIVYGDYDISVSMLLPVDTEWRIYMPSRNADQRERGTDCGMYVDPILYFDVQVKKGHRRKNNWWGKFMSMSIFVYLVERQIFESKNPFFKNSDYFNRLQEHSQYSTY